MNAAARAERPLAVSQLPAGMFATQWHRPNSSSAQSPLPQCVDAARSAAAHLSPGVYFVDLNSVAPNTKLQAAEIIAATGRTLRRGGGDGADRTASESRHRCCSAARMRRAFQSLAQSLGFAGMHAFSADIGKASAAKMCRSVMVKGMEALLTESLLSARRYGVEGTVLDSLSNLLPGPDWRRAQQIHDFSLAAAWPSTRRGDARSRRHRERCWHRTAHESRHCTVARIGPPLYVDSQSVQSLVPMLDSILATIADPRSQ